MAESVLVSEYQLDKSTRSRVLFPPRQALLVLLVCVGYYLGTLVGKSLRFPSSHLSLIWPPTAIVMAALLLAPPRKWWLYLLAVSPVHILVQMQDSVPAWGILSQLVGNFGQALLGAASVRYFQPGVVRFDNFRGTVVFSLCAAILAPVLVSSLASYLYVLSGWEQDYWYVWRARVLSNVLSTLTIVPPILLGAAAVAQPGKLNPWRLMEAGLIAIGLVLVGIITVRLNTQVVILLYAPLPLLLWAAVRFGVEGLCLAILVTAYMVFLDVSGGQGPFTAKSPAENVLSLQLFLITISLPLIFLAGLISERRDKESALRESEARYRALVMASANMVWRANAEGEGFFVTPGWHDLTGQSEDEASNFGWLKALHPKDQARSERLWKQAMTQKRMYENEFRVRTRDGSYRHFRVQAVPIVALDSRVHEWVGAAVDITERKEAALEAQRHRDELAHVTRVTTMGELAASLAHELNQPLTAIRSNAQAAQRFLAANPADLGEVRDILRDIVDDNSRASEVIRRLRELAKKSDLEVAALDLPALVRDVVRLIHSDAVLHNVNVVLEMDSRVRQIQGDKVQLQQVILNLLLNAFQAMKDCPANERQVTIRTELDDPMAIIAVRDHGAGVRGDQLERIFQPFYTTKDNGLGMGLAISRSIVEAHGGRLWAQNSPDRGATFHFTVPVGKNDEAVMNKEGGPKVRPSGAPI